MTASYVRHKLRPETESPVSGIESLGGSFGGGYGGHLRASLGADSKVERRWTVDSRPGVERWVDWKEASLQHGQKSEDEDCAARSRVL